MLFFYFTTLDDPDGTIYSQVEKINDLDEVVGVYKNGQSEEAGFVSEDGIFRTIKPPSSLQTNITAVNNSSEIVGFYNNANYDGLHGFIEKNGTYTIVDDPGSNLTQVSAINDAGEVAGNFSNFSQSLDYIFTYDGISYTNIYLQNAYVTAINSSGEIAGIMPSQNAIGYKVGFIYSNGSLTVVADPLGDHGTFIEDFNDSGTVAGLYLDKNDIPHGFTYGNSIFETMDDPLGSAGTSIASINASGEVGGSYTDSSGVEHGFVEANGVFTTVDYPSAILTFVEDINASGEIIGTYEDRSGAYHGFEATPDVACFCRGTMILTERGAMPVETLVIGDRLITQNGTALPIRWIGRRSYQGRFVRGNRQVLPVCIKAGALGNGTPRRDLWVSPAHAMLIDGVLVEARDLVNEVSVIQAAWIETVEYFHPELETHACIVAEGALSETFLDDDSRNNFQNAHEYAVLYPNEKRNNLVRFCSPRVHDGQLLEAIRQRIHRRALARLPAERVADECLRFPHAMGF